MASTRNGVAALKELFQWCERDVHLADNIIEFLNVCPSVARLEIDDRATRLTGQLRMRCEPSEALVRKLAALRALNVNGE